MKRVWPLRLIQFSPLIVLSLMLAVWFATPRATRMLAFERATMRITPEMEAAGISRSDLTYDLELDSLRSLQSELDTNVVYTAQGTADGRLQTMANGVTGRIMTEAWRLYGTSGAIRPNSIASGSALFEALRAFEDETQSRVAVFVMPPKARPKVALRSVESSDVLTAEELADLDSDETLERIRRLQRGRDVQTLPVDIESLTSGTGAPHGDRIIYYTCKSVGGRVYEVYGVYPRVREGIGDVPELPDSNRLDSEANQRALDRLTRRWGGAAFVVGPVDDTLIPLRIPDTMDARNVSAGLQETLLRRSLDGWTYISQVPEEVAARFGGARWVGVAIGVSPGVTATGRQRGTVVSRQPLVFVATYESSPEVPLIWEQIGWTPWRGFRVWLSAHALWVAGILSVAFVASLIASPIAFVYERRTTAELELERERARVRLQARERVIARLTELSDRVERAAAASAIGTQDEVRAVASDIESTVSELRSILSGLSDEAGERRE